MTNKEFVSYVNSQKIRGLNDRQISEKLGMNVDIFKAAYRSACTKVIDESPSLIAKEINQKIVNYPERPSKNPKHEGVTYLNTKMTEEELNKETAKNQS